MKTLKIEELSKNFGATEVLKKINLEIDEGNFLVLLGPSGCGKSTLLNIIAGLETINEGNVYIDDYNVSKVEPKDRNIAMVFQSYALYPSMNVKENMVFGLKQAKTSKEKIEEQLTKVSSFLQVDELLNRKPSQLSGGQRQRVALARAIVRQPRVFLMDEPLSNLDAILRVTTRAELKNLHHRLGVTTIYVTHDQVEAMTLANRIAVMNHGKLLQFDKPQVIFDDPSSKFVAGFIGSPAMNLIDGRVENKKFIADGIKTSFDVDFEGEITLGVRPDKIHIVSDNEANNGSAKVYSVELTGEANLVTFKVNNQNLIVKTDKNTVYEIDSVLKLNFNKEDCYFFDINSEERLRI